MPDYNLQTGDIIMVQNPLKLFKPMSWLSTIIRTILGIPYNHVMVYTKEYGEDYVNEAMERGIVKVSLLKKFTTNDVKRLIVLRPTVPPRNNHEFIRLVNSTLGRNYDFTALVVHQLIYQIFGKWVGRGPTTGNSSFYCSELAQYFYNRPNWWKASPKDVLNDPFYKMYYTGTKQDFIQKFFTS